MSSGAGRYPRSHATPANNYDRIQILLLTAIGAFLIVTWNHHLCNLRQYPAMTDREDGGMPDLPMRHHHSIDKDASSSTNDDNITDIKTVDWIPVDDLHYSDVFAAAWWQSTPRFLELDASKIEAVEGDSFIPIYKVAGGKADARMAVDWLDFCVEHLSKWWRLMGMNGHVYVVGKLQSYVQRVMDDTTKPDSGSMTSTLALIPFGVDSDQEPIEPQVWLLSLAATIASLVRHQVGRVLVVGYYQADYELTKEAFELLLRYRRNAGGVLIGGNQTLSATLGSTELSYVTTTDVTSTDPLEQEEVFVNVPKGALRDLKEALLGKRPDWEKWVGTRSFKYIFMTESDQVLHARLSSLQFHDAMDKGGIVIPHRLQPISHPLDVQGLDVDAILPADEFPRNNVNELGRSDSCCDTSDRPGIRDFPECGSFWYFCGFDIKGENHSRFSSYEFMRLTSGMGIVNIASNEHSRICVPKQGGCQKFVHKKTAQKD